METYITHDNGKEPYKVDVFNQDVTIYKSILTIDYDSETTYNETPIFVFSNVEQVFIGKSPKNKMTLFSGGFGSKYDGNSILLHIKDYDYVFIGREIFRFKSFVKITEFVSPLGNNRVPYPFAKDCENRYYLLIENIVINNVPSDVETPYDHYYSENINIIKKGTNELDIKTFLIGGNIYKFSHNSLPNKNYDRISQWDDFGNGFEIIYINGDKQHLTRNTYLQIVNNWSQKQGLTCLKDFEVLQKQSW